MSESEEFCEFYQWLIDCSKSDEENIHTLQLTTVQTKKLLSFLIDNMS
jgi:hypothetical protein